MLTGAEIIQKYRESGSTTRANIICKNYFRLNSIIENSIDWMTEQIISDQQFVRREAMGDLGIRVQTSSRGDVTGNTSCNCTMVRQAIETCDFAEVNLKDVDDREKILEDSFTLREMRRDLLDFNRSISNVLEPDEIKLFKSFLKKEKGLQDIAEEFGIQYDSADRRINRMKKRVIKDMNNR